jgi:hypothetical protein
MNFSETLKYVASSAMRFGTLFKGLKFGSVEETRGKF